MRTVAVSSCGSQLSIAAAFLTGAGIHVIAGCALSQPFGIDLFVAAESHRYLRDAFLHQLRNIYPTCLLKQATYTMLALFHYTFSVTAATPQAGRTTYALPPSTRTGSSFKPTLSVSVKVL